MPKILIAGAVLLVLIIGFVIFGAFLLTGSVSSFANAQEPSETAVAAELQVETNEQITINKVLGTPVVYKDLEVTLDGKIVSWVTKNAIVVSEVSEKNSVKKLLLICDQKFRLPDDVPASDIALGENVNVSFTGTVGILKIGEGDTSLGDEIELRELRKWNNKPVIFANSVVQK